MCAKLSSNGKAAILMPNGATTSNTKDDERVRKEMIDQNKVEAIIQLPNKLFTNVSLSVQC
ncbi:N-6 DNA methylase [bacterium]|nr:N-6 DNA methylase [bacterium]